jgi:TetR/AcrR family transcriptional regulator, transcriptional repressor for nem operon
MNTSPLAKPARGQAREQLLAAALKLIRARGYSATSVDDLCKEAGVTKGAFFHHFPTKDALAVAAANHWTDTTSGLFAGAPYHNHARPLDRVLGYVDFRHDILAGELWEFTCLVGTMTQEVYGTQDDIRAACEASICGHARTLEADIEAAMQEHHIQGDWTAQSLALHTQAVLQGAFILAKATGKVEVAIDSALHLKRYIQLLFNQPVRSH